ncbi:ImmA/IrrE family metallo-endopeptidase [Enterococcus asini]|uniref:ImmA/IrrE family metallo-endopeptidase n=1 Tax=Enterococcus asini TaxID=57732 RepID=UPI0022E742F9|nr:ImmA/IrrE family metallo-endopeptidase [Enterococcus asini]
MNDFEALLDEVSSEVPVIESPILAKGYEGLYKDNYIFLEKSLSDVRKKEMLMEEYGHHKTSVGTIINYDTPESRKQEARARRVSLEALVSLDKLVECSFAGLKNKFECAEYLNVSVDTLSDAISHYSAKFGPTYLHKGYLLHFDSDSIMVLKTGK